MHERRGDPTLSELREPKAAEAHKKRASDVSDGFLAGWRRDLRRWCLDRFTNLYPPFLGAGIKVIRVAPDNRSFEVQMKLSFLNRSYVGAHYGGSLYSMCDPFYVLILIKNLGNGYIVWDKAATIQFKKPGRGTVRATISLSKEQIDQIKLRADTNGKTEETLPVEVIDDQGEVILRVEKVVYVRKKV